MKPFSIGPNDVFLDVTREGRILIRRTTVPPLTPLGIIVNWSDYVKPSPVSDAAHGAWFFGQSGALVSDARKQETKIWFFAR